MSCRIGLSALSIFLKVLLLSSVYFLAIGVAQSVELPERPFYTWQTGFGTVETDGVIYATEQQALTAGEEHVNNRGLGVFNYTESFFIFGETSNLSSNEFFSPGNTNIIGFNIRDTGIEDIAAPSTIFDTPISACEANVSLYVSLITPETVTQDVRFLSVDAFADNTTASCQCLITNRILGGGTISGEATCGSVEPSCPLGYNKGNDNGLLTCRPMGVAAPSIQITTFVDEEEQKNAGDDEAKGKGVCRGNPINLGTGNKLQTEVDYVSVESFPLRMERYYNSVGAAEASLGTNWTHYYHRLITESVPNVEVVVTRPTGTALLFRLQNGEWQSDSDVTSRLEQLFDGASVFSGWRYTTPDEMDELYNTQGQLVSLTDRSGKTQTLTYEPNIFEFDMLATVTSHFGRTLVFSYNDDFQISSITDPDGQEYLYTYDEGDTTLGLGNLTSIRFPDLSTRRYLYEDPNFPSALTGLMDENNDLFASWSYDATTGRAISSQHATGFERVDLDFNPDGSTTATDARSDQNTYGIANVQGVMKSTGVSGTPCSNCGGQFTDTSYDANGFIERLTDFRGHTTSFIKDDRGLAISRTEALGTTEERTILTDYLTAFRLPERVRYPSVATGQFKQTVMGYDDPALPKLPTSITINGFTPTGTAIEERAYSMKYNSDGQVIEIDGPRTDVNDVTLMTYYPNTPDQGNNQGMLHTTTNALGHVTTYELYDAHAHVMKMVDPNNVTYEFEYDVRLRMQLSTMTPEVGEPRITDYDYDDANQLISLTTPNGVTLTYDYNAAHYLIRVDDNQGNYTEYGYDLDGNVMDEDTYDPNGLLTLFKDYTYDPQDRLASINDAGNLTQTVYDLVGNLAATTDPNNNPEATNEFDALDRMIVSLDRLGQPSSMNYDVQDNLTQVTSKNDAVTNYAYDDLRNMLSETSADRGIRVYTHDAAGNIIQMTDARGIVQTNTYDALNRMTSITVPDAQDGTQYTYDTGESCGFSTGRLCRITKGPSEIEYGYDAYGNIIAHQGITYAHDVAGRVTSMTYPSGNIVRYTYNEISELESVTLDTGTAVIPLASQVDYLPFGPMRNITYGFGGTQTHNYDQQYRLTAQTLPGVHEMTYPDYDANSNLRQRTDPILSNITNYGYDALDRLDLADGDFGNVDYDYDPNDNRTLLTSSAGSESYNYITNTNQLIDINGEPVPRDAAGNITRLNQRDFSYDGYNRLITAQTPGGSAGNTNNYTYAYNGLGQRATKRLNITFPEPDLSGDIVSPGFNFSTAGSPSQTVETTLDPYSTFTIEEGVTYSLEADFSSFGFLRVGSTDGESNFAAVLSRNIGRNVSTVSTTIFGTIISGKGSSTGVLAHADSSYHASIILTTGSLRITMTDSTGAVVDTGEITVNGLNTNDSYHLLRQSGLSNISLTRSQLSESTTTTNASTLGAALYTYDLQGRVIYEVFEAGIGDKEYIYLNNQPLALVEGDNVYYIYNDHLNTPQRLSDLQGNIVWQASYSPFGAATINDDVDGDGQGVSFNLRFPGQYFDVESNLHYNYYRYYSPQIGRYITSDPIGLDGGLNTFGYVKGNPIGFYDPTGTNLKLINHIIHVGEAPMSIFGQIVPRVVGHPVFQAGVGGAIVGTIINEGIEKYYFDGKSNIGGEIYEYFYPYDLNPEINSNSEIDPMCR